MKVSWTFSLMSADYVCLIGIWVCRSTLFRQRVDFAEIKTVSDLVRCFSKRGKHLRVCSWNWSSGSRCFVKIQNPLVFMWVTITKTENILKTNVEIQLIFNPQSRAADFPFFIPQEYDPQNLCYSETKTCLTPIHRFKHFTADNTHNSLFILISGRHERWVYSESGDHIHEKNPTDEPRKVGEAPTNPCCCVVRYRRQRNTGTVVTCVAKACSFGRGAH